METFKIIFISLCLIIGAASLLFFFRIIKQQDNLDEEAENIDDN